MPEETKPKIPVLSTPTEVDAVIEQAAREEWASLGLRFRASYALPPTHPFPHTFRIETKLSPTHVARVGTLARLARLGISGNSIGDPGAEHIAKLAALTQLDISGDSIGDPGAEAILDSWASREGMAPPLALDLRENGDLRTLLPKEALETSDAQAILAAYRRLQRDRDADQLQP